jgi:hypothetical protein
LEITKVTSKKRWFLPGYLWALPHTLVGLLLCLVYRAHAFSWHEGVLTCLGGLDNDGGTRIWGRPGAQTHGWLVIYADERQRSRTDLRVHEYQHVWQGFLGGPLYMLAYGFTFLWNYLGHRELGWKAAYYKIPFEIQAYDRGNHARPGDWGFSNVS